MQYDAEENKVSELSTQFSVLGSYPRLQLLLLLRDNEMCVGDIAEKLRMSQSAISQHLKKLRASELVMVRRHMQNRYYSIDRNKFGGFIDNLSVLDCLYAPIMGKATPRNMQSLPVNQLQETQQ